MEIRPIGDLDSDLVDWNNRMYLQHPTPYTGVAGVIERARCRKVLEFAQIGSADAVLELGCEAGNLLINAPLCRRIVGADISPVVLKDASRVFADRGRDAEFFQLDAQQLLPFYQGEFDVIICSEMLEHVENPTKVLENVYEISTPATRIVVTVPLESPKIFIKRCLNTIGLLKLIFPRIEEGQSEWHLHAFSRRKLLEISGKLFAVKEDRTLWGTHYIAHLQKH